MPTKFDNMTMAQLREQASVAADKKAEYDEIIKNVKAEIAIRAKDDAEQAYKDKGVDTGTARTVIDGVPLKLNRSKTVIWDQPELRRIARTLPADEAKKIFKLEIGIDEKVYNAIENEELKKQLKKARTIKAGKSSVDFEIKVT